MDQKNTIVKCNRSPKCLFEYNGVCDNYVINIGADGQCECYIETEPIKEQKTCQDDCIHFDDSDPMVGPMCLFKHPEPLKEFYKDMPCDYYHKRGQRAKCNVYSITRPNKPIQLKMTIAEFDKITKNKSTIKDVMPECDLPICNWSCKYALRDGPSFNPYIWCDLYKMNPAMGLFCSLKEEEKNEI